MTFPGNIAILGGGSWATALAKLLLVNNETIHWYMRRDDRIEEFLRLGHNPAYLTDVDFDVNRIYFSSDINEVCDRCDTLVLATPSPYFKDHMAKLTTDISQKAVVSAIKGIVPDENVLITDYVRDHFGVSPDKTLVISGPCHAEEVALSRTSYLTIGCEDIDRAADFARCIQSKNTHTITSSDVDGIEYAAVLNNVYAIAAGIIHRLQTRDSRNHNFGAMIGRGDSVKAAKMEMEQTAEGYYGTKCIHDINKRYDVEMPILEGVYDILYRRIKPANAMRKMGEKFT